MLDASDARDPDRAYRDYLEMCRRLSIEPMARERADELGAEFVSMLTGHPMPPAKFWAVRRPRPTECQPPSRNPLPVGFFRPKQQIEDLVSRFLAKPGAVSLRTCSAY